MYGVFYVLSHLDLYLELWSGHVVLVVVGVRMSIRVLTSFTDRSLQATLMLTCSLSLLCHINISLESYSDTEF